MPCFVFSFFMKRRKVRTGSKEQWQQQQKQKKKTWETKHHAGLEGRTRRRGPRRGTGERGPGCGAVCSRNTETRTIARESHPRGHACVWFKVTPRPSCLLWTHTLHIAIHNEQNRGKPVFGCTFMRFQTNALDRSLFILLYINHKFISALKMFLLCLGVLMIFL